jgi:excisionase family DNA binding protein
MNSAHESEHLRPVPSPLMNVQQVAEYLGCSPNHVYRLRVRDGLPSILYGRRGRRFRKDDVDRWLDEQERAAA